ncbi:MAG: UDP-N-acetylmuramoyl-L-alanyl-D-glutamate--2,6-diaminopimelate ligase [Actinomycetota bacterium]|nr:UDP-N-acetylmuramoyl-L-alanyl-D-glutamate--2,6-diaminopimelate ligase [Actinomycetota bacterium]
MTTLERIAGDLPVECEARIIGEPGHRVGAITHDSRIVAPGMAFACLRGDHHDGHEHAQEAVAKGATSLIVDHEVAIDGVTIDGVAQLVVRDVRGCLGWMASTVSGTPSASIPIVGITGTNGKTTTSHLLASILEAAGRPTGVIGTLSGARTTPEAPELQDRLAGFVAGGKAAVVMEVSSHALQLHRVDGTTFALAVFTNLGEDHLDLHGSMEGYFRAKFRLFEAERTTVGVVNVDDLYGRLLADAAEIDIVPFSRADASGVVVEAGRLQLTWRDSVLVVPIGGDFNVMNVLAAATAADVLGIERDAIAAGLAAVAPVPGRFQRVDSPVGLDVIVDYAHTPEGLESLLAAARSLARAHEGGRVIAVFGCGGDRDTQKRPHMGAVAAARSDVTIVTSDNPRHEEPLAIIDAIVHGVDPTGRQRLIIEPDRAAAIKLAVDEARPGDVVVIAGKGHETTQTIGDRELPFDDRLVAAKAMAVQAERFR